jgi:hypothetical protein
VDTIYVALEDEGVDVWGPVAARREGPYYRITAETPDDETWAFPSGMLVRCEKRELNDGPALVAVEAV